MLYQEAFVMLINPDKFVRFRDPRLNLCEESRPKASKAAFSTNFFRGNFRPEVASDVISGAAIMEEVGMDVRVNFDDIGRTVIEIFEPLTL